jgi:hypothetical protein
MATDIQELREASAWQWADTKAQIVALVAQLSRLDERMHDSSVVTTTQQATIGAAFASDAESVLACSLVERTRNPSLQVGTLTADSTRAASFVTAWTSANLAETISNNNAMYPRQLMIRGIGTGTTVLRSSEFGYGEFRYGHQLMVAVEEEILVPTIHFGLVYAGKAIREMTDMSSVPQDATVHAHYRPIGMERRLCTLEDERLSEKHASADYGSPSDAGRQEFLLGDYVAKRPRLELLRTYSASSLTSVHSMDHSESGHSIFRPVAWELEVLYMVMARRARTKYRSTMNRLTRRD